MDVAFVVSMIVLVAALLALIAGCAVLENKR